MTSGLGRARTGVGRRWVRRHLSWPRIVITPSATLAEWRRLGWPAIRLGLAVRGVLLVSGGLLIALPSPHHAAAVVLTSIAVVAALIAPRTVGASPMVVTAVIAWLAAGGWRADPAVVPTVLFGYALLIAQLTIALTSAVPVVSRLEVAVLRRWAIRTTVISTVAGALMVAAESLGRLDQSTALPVAGLIGVVLLIAVPAVRARSFD